MTIEQFNAQSLSTGMRIAIEMKEGSKEATLTLYWLDEYVSVCEVYLADIPYLTDVPQDFLSIAKYEGLSYEQ
jgi:hypothetical protein